MKPRLLDKLTDKINNQIIDSESTDYNARQFSIMGKIIIYSTAKITPKKAGLFVTYWKRSTEGPIAPFHASDHFDFFMVELNDGAFLFPKSILISKGILSTAAKEGKRAFRIYPPWNIDLNKSAYSAQNCNAIIIIVLKNYCTKSQNNKKTIQLLKN